MPLFQSNLRKQIRKLPKFLQFVKIIHYYSELFISLLRPLSSRCRARGAEGCAPGCRSNYQGSVIGCITDTNPSSARVVSKSSQLHLRVSSGCFSPLLVSFPSSVITKPIRRPTVPGAVGPRSEPSTAVNLSCLRRYPRTHQMALLDC